MVPAKADLAVARRYIGLVTDRKLAATADQYIAIVLPGRMFKTAFAQRGLAPVMLSRTIGASVTPTSALVPRNLTAAIAASLLACRTPHDEEREGYDHDGERYAQSEQVELAGPRDGLTKE
jgi:hypothetical protein